MADPLLSVRNLRLEIATRRGPLLALDDVSFDIAPGEVLGVVGESGAGKSITGTAIIGLLDPPLRMTGGEIAFAGQRIDNLSAEAFRLLRGRSIGAVFQDPLTSLNPLLTVGRQLVQTMRVHLDISPAAARSRAVELLAEVGIPAPTERLDCYPHELSGGMRQRIVLALAFCCEPRLIIADEPTTALDVSVQAQVIELLRRMCRERSTAVMLITHDMGVIAETADRIAVMYAGRVVEIGPATAVLKGPVHPYTRGLMASIPSMKRRTADLVQVEGSMPRLAEIPSGCAFHPRCPVRLPHCDCQRPSLMNAGDTLVACWLAAHGSVAPTRETIGHA
jgi:peptide/nickel transport system ATP-binding protein